MRLVSPFIGGGFGSKLFLRADAVLAALGARAIGRPVKVALTRPLVFNIHGDLERHQPRRFPRRAHGVALGEVQRRELERRHSIRAGVEPIISAAVWAMIVYEPVPMSVMSVSTVTTPRLSSRTRAPDLSSGALRKPYASPGR